MGNVFRRIRKCVGLGSKKNAVVVFIEDERDTTTNDVIDAMVERFLCNDRINNPLIPDFIERTIYRNVYRLLIGLIQENLESSSVLLLGHRVTLTMTPVPFTEQTGKRTTP